MLEHQQQDQLVVIKVEGMHCHKCQQAIRKALQVHAGVHEVEIDMTPGLVSVLYDPAASNVRQFMDAIIKAGYRAVSYTRGTPDRLPQNP